MGLRMYREQGMYGQEQAYAAAWEERSHNVTHEERNDVVQEEEKVRHVQSVDQGLQHQVSNCDAGQNSSHEHHGTKKTISDENQNGVDEDISPKEETTIEEESQDIDEDETNWLNSSNEVDPDLED